MINSYPQLPDYYEKLMRLDLLRDRALFKKMQCLSIIIYALFFIAGILICPLNSQTVSFAKVFTALAGTFIYTCMHEGVHGIFMKLFGSKKVSYGFKMGCAYAGSDDFYKKKPYIVIALSPVVILGICLLLLNLKMGRQWFWVVYFVQLANLSGAAGDILVAAKVMKLPKDILITDSGTAMTIYIKNNGCSPF